MVLLINRSAALQGRVVGQIAAAVSQDRQGQTVPHKQLPALLDPEDFSLKE